MSSATDLLFIPLFHTIIIIMILTIIMIIITMMMMISLFSL